MAYFKYQSTKQINALRQTPAVRVWQRNYYEHIIRKQASLDRIRQYIRDNPARWAFDRDNPTAVFPEPEDIRPIQPEKEIGGKPGKRLKGSGDE